MLDVIVLAKTRWHLRKTVRTVNQHFNQLKVAQAPDKTFIGRIEKGFDFLGYRFGQEKLRVSKRTLENHIRRLSQIYEQKKHQPN
jgi:RNA-directed DNA polymerase